jgi:hypothetical protein
MRRFIFTIALTTATLSFAGCHQSTTSATNSTSSESLAEKQARWEAMHQQFLDDCVKGTPEHVHDNQPLCDAEKAKMAPLGNELIKLEQEAAQHQNP